MIFSKDKNLNYLLHQKITPQTPLFFLASCPLNCEDLLIKELENLGMHNIVRLPAGAEFCTNTEGFYTCCMWLRTASSLKLILKKFQAEDREALYQQALDIPWFDHLSAEQTFSCQATVSKQSFAPANYLTLLVKDAIADAFRRAMQSRPNVNTEHPDLVVALHMDGMQATLSIELGRSLQQRAWQRSSSYLHGTVLKKHTLSLQENLASALLYRLGWPKAAKEGKIFLDPMCHNGIFALEACAMASDRAPGLGKERIGFESWRQFDKDLWQQIQQQAKQRFNDGVALCPPVHVYSTNVNTIPQLEYCCQKAELSAKILIQQIDFFKTEALPDLGLMLIHPPHGQVYRDPQKVRSLYQEIGQHLKKNYCGWDIGLIMPSEELLREIDVRAEKVNSFFNGSDKNYLARFSLYERVQQDIPLTPEGLALKEFLTKRYATLQSLAQKQWRTNVYRLYNNEKPGYLALCDLYDDTLVIQPFKSTPQVKELARICQEITGITRTNTLIKKRKQGATGHDQYSAQKQMLPIEKIVFEQDYRFIVNLSSYIDTGFYLDHRALRRQLAKECPKASVLNLFCYTGSISIVAAGSGATRVCSVDTSHTYLAMAQKNAQLNKLNSSNLEWICQDVQDFLQTTNNCWDIIYVDPPTYSNSKGRKAFDIQRDHGQLLELCLKHLNPRGSIYFSTHFHKFKLDTELLTHCQIEDISSQSLDEDCRGRHMVHYLWKIQHKK